MFKVSPEDVQFVSEFKWRLDSKGYAVRPATPGTTNRMNRLIAARMGLDIEGLQVDHKNGVRTDNRRCNLRVATNGQNRANSKLNSDNKSGFKGVHLKRQTPIANRKYKKRSDAMGDRWVAQINVDGKKRHLGYFETKEEAHAAYSKAAREAFGEFAKV